MTKILVVDDNEQNLYILKVLLEGQEYNVVTAQNGIEALEAARSSPPDLIVSDILMPGMDGFSLCRQWKTDDQLKEIPFIFYTATYTDDKDEDFALSLGAERFIRKPAEVDELIKIVRDVLEQYAKEKTIITPSPQIIEEKTYFKTYNETLIRKMEAKLLELEQANQRLSALFQTSVDLTSSMLPQDLITHVLKNIIKAISCAYACYFEFDPKNKKFYLAAAAGFAEKDLTELKRRLVFDLGEKRGMIGLVGHTRETLISSEPLDDPRWIDSVKSIKSIKSVLILPAIYEERMIGVWSFLSDETEKFNEKAVRDLETLTNNMAIAIERNRLFDEIKQSEHRYRTLVETSIDAIVTIDTDGLITDWSRGAEQVFGYTKTDRIGKDINDLVPLQNRKQMAEILQEVCEKGYKRAWESQLLTKNASLLDIEMTLTYLGDELGFTIILRDVTSQKQGERALRESEKFLNNIIENIPDMIFVKDAEELRFIRFNKAGEDLMGYSRDEMVGKNDYDFFPKEEADFFVQNDKGVLRKKQYIEIPEEKIQTKNDEEKILHTKKIPLLDDTGKPQYLLGISEDITRRRQLEKLIDALNKAAFSLALTPELIFVTIAKELEKLNLSCMLFTLDDMNSMYFSACFCFDSSMLDSSTKSSGALRQDFSLSVDAIELFGKVITEKMSIFTEDTNEIIEQLLLNHKEKVPERLIEFMRQSRVIIAPLIMEEKVTGIFAVRSNSLTREDTPSVTAFANQLAAAWSRAILTTKLQQTIEGIIQTIALIVEMRDPYTAGHQERVSKLATAIARELDLSDDCIEGVRLAGILHDLGKISVPAEILTKPGKLTNIEYDLVKTHPQVGYDLLKNIDFPWPLAQIVLEHHEKMNGSGYPQGLKGTKILLQARIIAVADVVEAMASHRPYRPMLGIDVALQEIEKNKGILYDEKIVDACMRLFRAKNYNFNVT